MNFIDIFNFKKYLKTYGDATLARVGHVNAMARPYKVYTALLTQLGANAPTDVVLENTLGAVITYTYLNPGVYLVTSDINLFTSPTEHVIISGSYNTGAGDLIILQAVPVFDNLAIIVSLENGVSADDIMGTGFGIPGEFPCVFEIKIYI